MRTRVFALKDRLMLQPILSDREVRRKTNCWASITHFSKGSVYSAVKSLNAMEYPIIEFVIYVEHEQGMFPRPFFAVGAK